MIEHDVRYRWFENRFRDDRNWQGIHLICQIALWNYLIDGYQPGGFMMGVLSNRLYKAVGSADHVNFEKIGYVTKFVMQNLPSACCGSPETVAEWMKLSNEARESILVSADLIPNTFTIIKFVAEENA